MRGREGGRHRASAIVAEEALQLTDRTGSSAVEMSPSKYAGGVTERSPRWTSMTDSTDTVASRFWIGRKGNLEVDGVPAAGKASEGFDELGGCLEKRLGGDDVPEVEELALEDLGLDLGLLRRVLVLFDGENRDLRQFLSAER
jgi:hypothetical protein